jgi:hypothetical protein
MIALARTEWRRTATQFLKRFVSLASGQAVRCTVMARFGPDLEAGAVDSVLEQDFAPEIGRNEN